MKVFAPEVPAELRWVLAGMVALSLAWAVRHLPWNKVRDDREAQRVLAITTAALILLRTVNTHAMLGVHLHFIGAAIATLMFGPVFAVWVMVIVSLVSTLFGHVWLGFVPDALVTGMLPVALTWLVAQGARRWLPPNLFIYVMVNAYLAGALSMLASVACKALVAKAMGGAVDAYVVAALPMAFGEAFLTGGWLAIVVVYRPQWCASFDDAHYLHGR